MVDATVMPFHSSQLWHYLIQVLWHGHSCEGCSSMSSEGDLYISEIILNFMYVVCNSEINPLFPHFQSLC